MKRTEAHFIPHCDFGECDLGAFWYKCPSCDKSIDDYEIWWNQDELWDGHQFAFICPNCGADLLVEWNKEEGCYYVTEIER